MNNRSFDSTDRHKVPRLYESGHEKRKRKREKEQKEGEMLSKTRRLTDFFSSPGDNSEDNSSVSSL